MDNIRPVIKLMAKSAVKENKTADFLEVCERIKAGIFNDMLKGTITKPEARSLRDFILEQEGAVKNGLITE